MQYSTQNPLMGNNQLDRADIERRVRDNIKAGRKPDAGFTLVELLVSVAIIGVMAAIAVPQLLGAREKGRIAKCEQEFNALDGEIANRLDSAQEVGENAYDVIWGMYDERSPNRIINVDDPSNKSPYDRSRPHYIGAYKIPLQPCDISHFAVDINGDGDIIVGDRCVEVKQYSGDLFDPKVKPICTE